MVYLSKATRDQVGDKLDVRMEDMGEEVLKNMAQPVHAYRATPLARQAAEGSSYKYAALALPDERSTAVLSFRACPCPI
jgi:adenylate cyclase